jgi:hypothetical protein
MTVGTPVSDFPGQTSGVPNPEEALAKDFLRLIAAQGDLKLRGARGRGAKIDLCKVGRIVDREHGSALEKFERLAVAYRVDAWRLNAPNLGAIFVVTRGGRPPRPSRPPSWRHSWTPDRFNDGTHQCRMRQAAS